MEWNQIKSNWIDYKNKIKSNWIELKNRQIDDINGNRELLAQKLQETYGFDSAETELQISAWENNLLNIDGDAQVRDKTNLNQKLKENQFTNETVKERDTIIDSPYHKGY
ncbi:MAG TPA: hypothetical protein VES38_01640 [Methylotenera sp.]|nr:hypothetical protein [Methylotenera sp.]